MRRAANARRSISARRAVRSRRGAAVAAARAAARRGTCAGRCGEGPGRLRDRSPRRRLARRRAPRARPTRAGAAGDAGAGPAWASGYGRRIRPPTASLFAVWKKNFPGGRNLLKRARRGQAAMGGNTERSDAGTSCTRRAPKLGCWSSVDLSSSSASDASKRQLRVVATAAIRIGQHFVRCVDHPHEARTGPGPRPSRRYWKRSRTAAYAASMRAGLAPGARSR